MKALHEPLVKYLIIFVLSFGAALVSFEIGGSIAKIAGEEGEIAKLSFEAGGAIAGFLIIFLFSLKAIRYLEKNIPVAIKKIHLLSAPKRSEFVNNSFRCKIRLYDQENGDERELAPRLGWEAGFLTIYLKPNDIRPTDYYMIVLNDGNGKTWQSETNDINAPRISLTLLSKGN